MEGMESGGKSNYLVKLRTLRTSTRPFLTLLPDTLRLDIAKILAYSMAFTTGLRFTFLGVRKRWASGWSLATFSGLLLMTPSTDFLHGNYWHPLGVLRAFLLCRILICWASFCKFQWLEWQGLVLKPLILLMTPVLNSWIKIERCESESGSFLCGPEIICRGKKKSCWLCILVKSCVWIVKNPRHKFLSVLKISLA